MGRAEGPFLEKRRLPATLRVTMFIVTGSLLQAAGATYSYPHAAAPSRNFIQSIAWGEFTSGLTIVALAFAFRRFLDRRPAASLGLAVRGHAARLLAIGACIGAAMQLFILILERSLGLVRVSASGDRTAAFHSIEIALPFFLMLAIAEETPLRGYIFQNLREAWGVVPAAAASSLIFAAAHLGNPGLHDELWVSMLALALFGAWACASVVLSGSLWLAIGCHWAWNLFEGPVLGFPVSGLQVVDVPLVRQVTQGPQWFTGGRFGPEGGWISILALAFGWLILYALHSRGALHARADACVAMLPGTVTSR